VFEEIVSDPRDGSFRAPSRAEYPFDPRRSGFAATPRRHIEASVARLVTQQEPIATLADRSRRQRLLESAA
jgi:hypothetical protein